MVGIRVSQMDNQFCEMNTLNIIVKTFVYGCINSIINE